MVFTIRSASVLNQRFASEVAPSGVGAELASALRGAGKLLPYAISDIVHFLLIQDTSRIWRRGRRASRVLLTRSRFARHDLDTLLGWLPESDLAGLLAGPGVRAPRNNRTGAAV